MSKASIVVACVTQQSRQRVPKSRIEYRKRPKATWVQAVRPHDKLMTSGGAQMTSLCHLVDRNTIVCPIQYGWLRILNLLPVRFLHIITLDIAVVFFAHACCTLCRDYDLWAACQQPDCNERFYYFRFCSPFCNAIFHVEIGVPFWQFNEISLTALGDHKKWSFTTEIATFLSSSTECYLHFRFWPPYLLASSTAGVGQGPKMQKEHGIIAFVGLKNSNIVFGTGSVVEYRETLLLPVSVAILLRHIEIDVPFVAAHRCQCDWLQQLAIELIRR